MEAHYQKIGDKPRELLIAAKNDPLLAHLADDAERFVANSK
jgi:hypothetical protein